jgi:hypothetical protein
MKPIRFTVVILLPEARGLAERCVRSWVSEQDFARDSYEVLVVSDGGEPEIESRIQPLLGANDRVLQYAGENRSGLYDHGARAARGEFVIITESHCIAEPNFLTELEHFLASHSFAGACCRGVPMPGNALSRIAGHAFEDGYRIYTQPDDWRKVNIHACAIRRDAFLACGGLDARYGVFAEMLLANELWQRGYRLGYAENAKVWHQFDGRASESLEFNRMAVTGEMNYYRDHPHGPAVPHTFLADLDTPHSAREIEVAAFRALWAARGRGFWPAVQQGLRALPFAISESRVSRICDHIRARLNTTVCRVLGSESSLSRKCFLRSWKRAAQLARKEYLASVSPEDIRRTPARTLCIDELPEHDLWGFHLPERWQGEPMRWTSRCAVLRLAIPANTHELVLHTNGVGWSLAGREVSFHYNGTRLPPEAVRIDTSHISFRVPAFANTRIVTLAIVCDPVPTALRGTDDRDLGFPIFRIQTATATSASRHAA